MHYRLLVTTNKENGETSEAVREFVFDYLCDEGYVVDGQRFNTAYGDWLEIGGRWSGILTGISDEVWHKRWEERDDMYGCEDDAQIVTEELYEKFLAPYENRDDESQHVDTEFDLVTREFIEKKWLVVVDYHC